MSNHWINWVCLSCERQLLIRWLVEPGWPSGLVHRREGWCATCFEGLAERPFVIDEEVTAAINALRARLSEVIPRHVAAMEGRPKERFLSLGLDDISARTAAEAYSQAHNSASAHGKRKQSEAVGFIFAAAEACMRPGCTLLLEVEQVLLQKLDGPCVTIENSQAFSTMVGNPHVPQSLIDHGIAEPLEGSHDCFYVAEEHVQINLPDNVGALLRARAEGLPLDAPTEPSRIDGTLAMACLRHEEAERDYGGVAGLLGERNALLGDPDALSIFERIRRE